MLDAVMLWNEPNNGRYWNTALDPHWHTFARMIVEAAAAIRAENPRLTLVLGGMASVDSGFLGDLQNRGALAAVDAVAVHGYPYDWDTWRVEQWPEVLGETARVTGMPVWVTEAGVSTFGADEPQEIGMRRTADMLAGRTPRVYWYCLYDSPLRRLPAACDCGEDDSTRARRAQMGLVRHDNTPKRACRVFAALAPLFGVCQWFDLFDPRLEPAVHWMKALGVRALRTGMSWADSRVPGARHWFDRQMRLIEPFESCLTFCFTPPSAGIEPHRASPPLESEGFAEFCGAMVRRYG